MSDVRVRVTIHGFEHGFEPIAVESGDAGDAPVVGTAARATAVRVRSKASSAADRAEGRERYEVVVDGWVLDATVEPAVLAALREKAARGPSEAGPHSPVSLRAQIPGRVVRVWVGLGDAVEAGQQLLAVEAMKMENEVRAPRAGTVGSVAVAIGQTVEVGDELVTLG